MQGMIGKCLRCRTVPQVLHFQWFADMGNAEAQRTLGQMLNQGGQQRDPAQALRYFRCVKTLKEPYQALCAPLYPSGPRAHAPLQPPASDYHVRLLLRSCNLHLLLLLCMGCQAMLPRGM